MGDSSICTEILFSNTKYYIGPNIDDGIGPNIGEELNFDTCEQTFSHDYDYVHVDKLSSLSPTLFIVTKTN